MNRLLAILLVVASVVLVGCVETRDEFTLNPDGSGKVLRQMTVDVRALEAAAEEVGNLMAAAMGAAMGGPATPPAPQPSSGKTQAEMETMAKDLARQMLNGSQGIDVWKDVSYGATPDGKLFFSGTAYFADISRLGLATGGQSPSMQWLYTPGADGTVALEGRIPAAGQSSMMMGAPLPGGAQARNMDDPAVDAEIDKAISDYQSRTRPVVEKILGGFVMDSVFHLPGQVSAASVFSRQDERTVRLGLSGAGILVAMDRMIADRQMMKTTLASMKDSANSPQQQQDMMCRVLFGEPGPVRVVSSSEGALFDYAVETAAAHANYQAMVDSLGLQPATAQPTFESLDDFALPSADMDISVDLPPLTDTGIRVDLPPAPTTTPAPTGTGSAAPVAARGNVRVAAVRLVRVSDSALGILPLGQRAGYTLSLMAELPEAAVKVNGGLVIKATTNAMQSLLPVHEWDRRILGTTPARDGRTILFEVRLALPDENATGLEGVSGTLEYVTAGGSQSVDIGTMAFEKGAKGSQFGAVIESIGTDPFNNNPAVIYLRLDIKEQEIESVEFSDKNIQMVSKQALGDATLVKCAAAGGPLPSSGSVAVKVYEDLQVKTFAFDIGGVSLTGGPMR